MCDETFFPHPPKSIQDRIGVIFCFRYRGYERVCGCVAVVSAHLSPPQPHRPSLHGWRPTPPQLYIAWMPAAGCPTRMPRATEDGWQFHHLCCCCGCHISCRRQHRSARRRRGRRRRARLPTCLAPSHAPKIALNADDKIATAFLLQKARGTLYRLPPSRTRRSG